MLESTLEPVEPDKNHESIDEDGCADHPHEIEDKLLDRSTSGVEFWGEEGHNLLIGIHIIDIHAGIISACGTPNGESCIRIESTLCSSPTGKEQSIDVR